MTKRCNNCGDPIDMGYSCRRCQHIYALHSAYLKAERLGQDKKCADIKLEIWALQKEA